VTNPSRGDIYWLDWNPARGSEQAGVRPALVIYTNQMNANPTYWNCVVVALTTKGRAVPTHVAIEKSIENGLPADSWVKAEQVLTVSKERLSAYLGRVSELEMGQVNRALLRVFALDSIV
jgi:mRNA interferase MazF